MRFVLGDVPVYDERLVRLIHFFVMNRVVRNEPMIGIERGGRLMAAAIVSHPMIKSSPPELADLKRDVWATLGYDARARYDAFGDASDVIPLPDNRIHLNMIGVRSEAQRAGYGTGLLDHVIQMAEAFDGADGITLTTETDHNVPYYESHGFRLLGAVEVDSAFTSRVMFRPNHS